MATKKHFFLTGKYHDAAEAFAEKYAASVKAIQEAVREAGGTGYILRGVRIAGITFDTDDVSDIVWKNVGITTTTAGRHQDYYMPYRRSSWGKNAYELLRSVEVMDAFSFMQDFPAEFDSFADGFDGFFMLTPQYERMEDMNILTLPEKMAGALDLKYATEIEPSEYLALKASSASKREKLRMHGHDRHGSHDRLLQIEDVR